MIPVPRPCLPALLAAGLLSPDPAAAAGQAVPVRTLRDPRIIQSSGLAVSPQHPGVLYTHNDSGDIARVFAIGPNGRVRATLTLAGVRAHDWEAIATGRDDAGRPALFIGDIGDNRGRRPSVSVYRITEPVHLRDATLPARRYRFRYADGARNAEALLVDPVSNRLYVASKQAVGGGLYQAPARLRSDQVNLLRRVAGVPPLVTDGAFSPDGRRLVLRNYLDAYVYMAPGRPIATVALPPQRQGESVCWSRDGRSLLVGSEGPSSRIWRVRLPAAAAPPTTAEPQPPAAEWARPPASRRTAAGWLLVLAGGALLLLLAARRRR